MRKLISVPIAMCPDLADWLTRQAKASGDNRSAYVRRLIEREKDSGICERVQRLEDMVNELRRKP